MGKNDDSGDEGFPSHKDESGFAKTFPQRVSCCYTHSKKL